MTLTDLEALTPPPLALAISPMSHEPTSMLLQVKAMVVGRQGAVIGQIGKLARIELDAIFQKTTHLILHVKVEKKHGQS